MKVDLIADRFKTRWDNFLTFGLTSMSFQIAPGDIAVFADYQLWCEPCQKVCFQWGIGRAVIGRGTIAWAGVPEFVP